MHKWVDCPRMSLSRRIRETNWAIFYPHKNSVCAAEVYPFNHVATEKKEKKEKTIFCSCTASCKTFEVLGITESVV